MQTLAKALLLQWWFLVDQEEEVTEAFGDDFMGDHYEGVTIWIGEMSVPELRAMEKAARDWLTERSRLPDEWGHTPRKLVSDEEREFFEGIAKFCVDEAAKKE